MKGDKDEGAYHEYYVTASYEGKIRGASQVNVNVVNPAHKSKPRDNSAIFSGTSAKSPRADQEKKITHAYFVDLKGNPVTQVKVGDTIKVRIRTRNMLNQRIRFVIWEYDVFSDDRIHTSPAITIQGDSMDMPAVTITQALFNKGIDSTYLKDPDRERQQYFIEVIPLKLKVSSSKFGLANSAEKSLEVVQSAAKVREHSNSKKYEKEKICECEARVRAYMRMLRIAEGTGELVKSSKYNKVTKRNEVVYIARDFESGYTKLFGGGNFTKPPHSRDMSTHPQIKILWYKKKDGSKVYSSASGAYQVMGYTWNDQTMISKRRTYHINDFSPEAQDKFCVVIFKHKRPGMLDLIIKGDIKGATEKYGSYEWASLPPGRFGQPIETMKKALELYEKFYKEELQGKSPLHLKKGFLKEFGYDCCEENTATPIAANSTCGKSEIDLRQKIKWQTQFDTKWGTRERQMVACKRTCDDILINSGLKATSLSSLYQTALENDTHTKLVINTSVSKDAISYLDSELEKGHPVQVGVDHGLGYKINNNADHSTDHFVVIVGRKCNGIKCYYLFYDVGTSHKEKGASDNNRLYLDETDKSLRGKTVYNGHLYTVTQIRKNRNEK